MDINFLYNPFVIDSSEIFFLFISYFVTLFTKILTAFTISSPEV